MVDVSFKPNILKKSQQMVAKRNRNSFLSENIGDEQPSRTYDTTQKSKDLYLDSFMRREKIDKMRRE